MAVFQVYTPACMLCALRFLFTNEIGCPCTVVEIFEVGIFNMGVRLSGYLCSSDEDLEPAAKRRKSEDLLGEDFVSVYSQHYICVTSLASPFQERTRMSWRCMERTHAVGHRSHRTDLRWLCWPLYSLTPRPHSLGTRLAIVLYYYSVCAPGRVVSIPLLRRSAKCSVAALHWTQLRV